MFRYFVLATGVVFAFILAVLSVDRARSRDARPAPYASTIAAPGSPRRESDPIGTALPVEGEAPWALSALPECFAQIHHASSDGPTKYHTYPGEPASWTIVRRGVLAVADCRLTVDYAGRTAEVVRADTHLQISHATISVGGDQLLLVTARSGARREERSYTLRDGRVPVFARR